MVLSLSLSHACYHCSVTGEVPLLLFLPSYSFSLWGLRFITHIPNLPFFFHLLLSSYSSPTTLPLFLLAAYDSIQQQQIFQKVSNLLFSKILGSSRGRALEIWLTIIWAFSLMKIGLSPYNLSIKLLLHFLPDSPTKIKVWPLPFFVPKNWIETRNGGQSQQHPHIEIHTNYIKVCYHNILLFYVDN